MKSRYLAVFLLVLLAFGFYVYFSHLRAPSAIKMPNLVSPQLNLNEARNQLESFSPGRIKIIHKSSNEPPGKVVGQQPAPGDVWIPGTEVALYVSKRAPDLPSNLDDLIKTIGKKTEQSQYAKGKVIVLSGTLMGKQNVKFSQLELKIIKKLREDLATRAIEVAEITREDWIFLNLPELGTPPLCQGQNNVLFLKVNLTPSEATEEMHVQVWGYTFLEKGLQNTDIVASITLDFSKGSYAKLLYNEDPAYIPLPKGTKENPFDDVDRLARTLVSEAGDSYPDGQLAAVDVKAHGSVGNRLISLLEGAISHCLDDKMEIVAAEEELTNLLERLYFEKRETEFEFTPPKPFSLPQIYILLEAMSYQPGESVYKINMKAFWLRGDQPGTRIQGLKSIAFLIHGGFDIKAELNKTLFRSGEPCFLEVQAAEGDCFVYVFCVTADGTRTLLFPHKESDDNFLQYGETTVIPPPRADDQWKVYTLGESRLKEKVLVIAVKYKVSLPKVKAKTSIGSVISSMEYERWLSSIPEKDCSVGTLEYTVKSGE